MRRGFLLGVLALGLLFVRADAQFSQQLTCCNGGSAAAGGGLAQGSGTTIADEQIVRGDTSGLQGSAASLTDAGVFSLTGQLNLDNLRLDGNTVSATNTNGGITLTPAGTGNLLWNSANLIQIGGTTANAAALKAPNAAGILSARTGDDSGYGIVNGARFRAWGNETDIGATLFGSVGVEVAAGKNVCWPSSSTDATQAKDICIGRNAAGRLKMTADGSTGVGVLLGSKGSDIASANDITLGAANYFLVTGTTQINTIAATNWTAGSCIVLQFSGTLTVKNATAGAGAQLKLAGSADFSATADDTLSVCYDGTFWRETARTAI